MISMGDMQPRPFHVDLSAMVPRRSVATLYSTLVTRPTGQALRLGIEQQIDPGELCVSILDFSRVSIIDYSCADEIVAKLIQRYSSDDRPAEAYFIARGMGDAHREPVEEVLVRHGLALVAECDDACELIGEVDGLERAAFEIVERKRRLGAHAVAKAIGLAEDAVELALAKLAQKRVVLRDGRADEWLSLRALLRG
ncbi:MAG TPA: hypothetical protein VF039_14820 [Longimicrobiales bacterium]